MRFGLVVSGVAFILILVWIVMAEYSEHKERAEEWENVYND